MHRWGLATVLFFSTMGSHEPDRLGARLHWQQHRSFPAIAGTAGSSLPLAVRRHVLSAARAYLTERRRNAASSAQPRETRPVELQQALQETLEASRRTSKAMRFIKHLKECLGSEGW